MESSVEVSPQQDEPRLQLTTAQKIALFRSLFRGREDVYAARWESPEILAKFSRPLEVLVHRTKVCR